MTFFSFLGTFNRSICTIFQSYAEHYNKSTNNAFYIPKFWSPSKIQPWAYTWQAVKISWQTPSPEWISYTCIQIFMYLYTILWREKSLQNIPQLSQESSRHLTGGTAHTHTLRQTSQLLSDHWYLCYVDLGLHSPQTQSSWDKVLNTMTALLYSQFRIGNCTFFIFPLQYCHLCHTIHYT